MTRFAGATSDLYALPIRSTREIMPCDVLGKHAEAVLAKNELQL
jgi:hypothetical protein